MYDITAEQLLRALQEGSKGMQTDKVSVHRVYVHQAIAIAQNAEEQIQRSARVSATLQETVDALRAELKEIGDLSGGAIRDRAYAMLEQTNPGPLRAVFPSFEQLTRFNRTSDQSVELTFSSCRACSEFCKGLENGGLIDGL